MRVYLDLLRHVLDQGLQREDRTGTGTLSVFGYQMRFDLAAGFPLCTTKRVWFRGLACEMLWFLSGSTNIKPLVDQNISIWTDWPLRHYLEANDQPIPRSDTQAWEDLKKEFEARIRSDEAFADRYGDLGPVYGRQWRNFCGIDQMAQVVQSIKENPAGRRHIVSAWNVPQISTMALPPCHMFFQFYVGDRRLSCQMYIRSNDLFLGAPFNIAQYALLTHLVADQTGLMPGELIYTIGDAHAYLNHLDQIQMQLSREPYPLPRLRIKRRAASLFDYRYEDFELIGYKHHAPLRAPVAV